MKTVIFGFGRMGITHYAILNQLIDDGSFTFIEPNPYVRMLAKHNINAKFLKEINTKDNYDLALICCPPNYHKEILEKLNGVRKIFVEKPFGGNDMLSLKNISANIKVGYVLRFNPIVQYVKKNVKKNKVISVSGEYLSNTISEKPKGWRNSDYSGVTNEMGSHILDLFNYLFDIRKTNNFNSIKKSVVSDLDDIVSGSFNSNDILFNFNFNWVNKKIRKPVFEIKIRFNDNSTWTFDQQKLEIFSNDKAKKVIYTTDLVSNISYYLRGVDFTLQMEDLLNDGNIISNSNDALVVRKIIKQILCQ